MLNFYKQEEALNRSEEAPNEDTLEMLEDVAELNFGKSDKSKSVKIVGSLYNNMYNNSSGQRCRNTGYSAGSGQRT